MGKINLYIPDELHHQLKKESVEDKSNMDTTLTKILRERYKNATM